MVPENKQTEDTSKLTLLTFKIIIPHNTRLATFIKASGNCQQRPPYRRTAIQERATPVPRSIPKEAFADSFQKLYKLCQPCVVKDGDYFEGQ
jgi:hypothetical protein